MVFQYTSQDADSASVVVKKLPAGAPLSGRVSIAANCKTACFVITPQSFSLTPGNWQIYIAMSSGVAGFKILSASAIPKEYYSLEALGRDKQIFEATCDLVSNKMGNGSAVFEVCRKGVFTLTMDYWHKPYGKHPLEVVKRELEFDCISR